MSSGGFHVHGPHDHAIEHATHGQGEHPAESHGTEGHGSSTNKIAMFTAIVATVGAIFAYMGGATQANAGLMKNDAAIKKTEASNQWNYFQSKSTKQSLAELARHHCTLCIFLSITLLHRVQEQLRAAGWADDAPMLVVHKASWPGEELIIRGTLADIRQRCRDAKVVSQAMVIASPNLGARHWPTLAKSKLYDASFTHRFRKASVPATPTETS